MRIAIVYDCLYPHTVGGAERWLRHLARSLADGNEVVYVTRRQWQRQAVTPVPGVECRAVAPGGDLYTSAGRRRLMPPVLFALGTFWHFVRRRRSYDVVHCVSYPYLPLLALRLALTGTETRVYCEWLEYLTPGYWRSYAGRFGGLLGRLVQWSCMRATPSAFVFSGLVGSRLREAGYEGPLHRLPGLWAGARSNGSGPRMPDEPIVLFAGRHVPDKQVTKVPDALALVLPREPGLGAVIVGDGPDRPRVLERVRELGLEDRVSVPGFVDRDEFEGLLMRAACLVSPSIRDGHGMTVTEAAAAGVPAVICDHPDNAATEVVAEGVNGAISEGTAAADIAVAIERVLAGGEGLRASTTEWFATRERHISMDASIEQVREVYGTARANA